MEWTYHDDGTVEMATDRLDLQALYDSAPQERFAGMAAGTAIGHIHLQVGNIPEADAFYRDVLGLKIMARYPGASFFATGGYHHHVAANIWNSRGAAARQDAMSGLSDYTLRFADEAALTKALAALEKLEIATRKTASGWALKDPGASGSISWLKGNRKTWHVPVLIDPFQHPPLSCRTSPPQGGDRIAVTDLPFSTN